MNYATYVLNLQNLLVVDSPTETNFVQILPAMSDYANDRIQNDLDLIAAQSRATAAMVAGTQSVVIPSDAGSLQINIINSVNAVTPAATAPDAGTRVPLQRLSVEALNWMWPTVSSGALP